MKDLKHRTIRGGFAKICAQVANFVLRIGSLMILARLLDPKDFGLVGMVTAVIGVLSLFRDFGLSAATIQRSAITEDQLSTLFWINLLVGTILGLASLAISPLVASFYREPRLFGVTALLATGFFFNAAGVQHSAILQRQMRFTALSVIDVISQLIGAAIGIAMALRGFGYWALVAASILGPLLSTVGLWLATGWVPEMPRRNIGIRSLMGFGGTVTVTGLLVYMATNADKVLLGRFWGANAIGIYGRAYQLINLPTDNLNATAGSVAFAALSRLQNDPPRLKSYFLKGYSLVAALTVPITLFCAFFAQDTILVLLGQKWKEAIAIFRLLAPTILVFAIVNPMSWLLCSLGMVVRLLKMSLVITPLMIAGYFIGLPYGPQGVAAVYSALMVLWMVPAIAWCVHGTVISIRDILQAVKWPLAAGLVAVGLAFGVRTLYGQTLHALPRLILETAIVGLVYLGLLLFATGQKSFYMDLLRGLKAPAPVEKNGLVSA